MSYSGRGIERFVGDARDGHHQDIRVSRNLRWLLDLGMGETPIDERMKLPSCAGNSKLRAMTIVGASFLRVSEPALIIAR